MGWDGGGPTALNAAAAPLGQDTGNPSGGLTAILAAMQLPKQQKMLWSSSGQASKRRCHSCLHCVDAEGFLCHSYLQESVQLPTPWALQSAMQLSPMVCPSRVPSHPQGPGPTAWKGELKVCLQPSQLSNHTSLCCLCTGRCWQQLLGLPLTVRLLW